MSTLLSSVEEDDSAVVMSGEEDFMNDCCGDAEFVVNRLPDFRELGNDRALEEDENAATSLQERLPRRKSVAIIIFVFIIVVLSTIQDLLCVTY